MSDSPTDIKYRSYQAEKYSEKHYVLYIFYCNNYKDQLVITAESTLFDQNTLQWSIKMNYIFHFIWFLGHYKYFEINLHGIMYTLSIIHSIIMECITRD